MNSYSSFDENNDSIFNNQVYTKHEIKNFEVGNEIEERNDSTNFTDSHTIVKNLTERGVKNLNKIEKKNIENKTEGKKNEYKLLGKKTKNESNTKYKRFNVLKKIMTHFQHYVIKIKVNIKGIKKIPYKINTQGNKNYLMCVFKGDIYSYLNQEIEKKRPNEKILKKLNTEKKKFLARNFLEVFYNDFIKILNKDYLEKNNIDEEEFEIWKKIIYYNPKKKKTEYKNEYEKYGLYQCIEESKGREAYYEYKLIKKIFKIEKMKKNSNIKTDNQNNENKDNNLSPNSNINNNLSSKSENKDNNFPSQDDNSDFYNFLSKTSNLLIDNSTQSRRESFDLLNMGSDCSNFNISLNFENE